MRVLLAVAMVGLLCCACSGDDSAATVEGTDVDIATDTGPGDVVVEADSPAIEEDLRSALDCAEGLVPWHTGACGPPMDQCQAWELPVIGGGCTPIGPRVCPKSWDQDSDADCEAGELLDCPEGFALTEDEVACVPVFDEECGELEVPLLGGGCMQVGPAFAPAGATADDLFDECEPGMLALPGGGCMQVGPRACPKLWDPDSTEECNVGDVLDCPGEWLPGFDPLFCEDLLLVCAGGEIPLPMSAGCPPFPLAEGICPEGPFPPEPADVTGVVYVDPASLCEADCGTIEAPYQTIQAAVDAAPDGAALLLAAGTYEAGAVVDRPLRLVGLCSGQTIISSLVELPPESGAPVAGAALAVNGAKDVVVESLGVSSEGAGVAVWGGASVALEGVEVKNVVGAGLLVAGESEASLKSCWLRGAIAGEDPAALGPGLHASGGAMVSMDDSLLESNAGAGVLAEGPGTAVSVSKTVVRSTKPRSDAGPNGGILVRDGAALEAVDSLLEINAGHGLFLSGAQTHASVLRTVVRMGKHSGAVAGVGTGIRAEEGAELTVVQSIINENIGMGLDIVGAGTSLLLDRTRVSNTSPGGGEEGRGVRGRAGPTLDIKGSMVVGNSFTGISLGNEGGSLTLAGSVIRNTWHGGEEEGGTGLLVVEQAEAEVADSVIEHSASYGTYVTGPGTAVLLERCVVRDTDNTSDAFSAGIIVLGGGEAVVRESLLERNRQHGFFVDHESTVLQVEDSVIRYGEFVPESNLGGGSISLGPSTSEFVRTVFHANECFGAEALDQAEVLLQECAILDTPAVAVEDSGHGLLALLDTAITVSHCVFRGNERLGIGIAEGSVGEIHQTLVADVEPSDWAEVEDLPVAGMLFTNGAVFNVSQCVVDSVGALGIVSAAGTAGVVEDTVVRGVTARLAGLGIGMLAGGGGEMAISQSHVSSSAGAGIASISQDSLLSLEQSVVSDTDAAPDINGEFAGGNGVLTLDSGRMSMEGCLVHGGINIGMVAATDATLEAVGSLVTGTRSLLDESGGQGVVNLDSSCSLERCALRDNGTIGLASYGASAKTALTECDVSMTRQGGAWLGPSEEQGEFQVFGDGILAVDGAILEVANSTVVSNGRSGIYYVKSKGKVSGTLITGCPSYGLAMDSCAQDVEWEVLENHIFGNAGALPEAMAAEVTENPGGLPVPPAPKISGVD